MVAVWGPGGGSEEERGVSSFHQSSVEDEGQRDGEKHHPGCPPTGTCHPFPFCVEDAGGAAASALRVGPTPTSTAVEHKGPQATRGPEVQGHRYLRV